MESMPLWAVQFKLGRWIKRQNSSWYFFLVVLDIFWASFWNLLGKSTNEMHPTAKTTIWAGQVVERDQSQQKILTFVFLLKNYLLSSQPMKAVFNNFAPDSDTPICWWCNQAVSAIFFFRPFFSREKSFFYKDRTLCKVGFSTPDMSYGWLPIKHILISLLFRSSPISRGRRRLDRRQLPLCSAIPEQQLQLSLLHHTQPRPRTSMVPRTKGTSYCSRWWFVWYAAWERSGG